MSDRGSPHCRIEYTSPYPDKNTVVIIAINWNLVYSKLYLLRQGEYKMRKDCSTCEFNFDGTCAGHGDVYKYSQF